MNMLVEGLVRFLSRGRLSVFLFHAVPHRSPEIPQDFTLQQFEEMLHFIRQHFDVIPLDDAVVSLKAGRLKSRVACLTFDDGYPSWATGVAPLLQTNNLHATFYITTGQFSGLPMWHERVARAISAFHGSKLEMAGFGLPPLPMEGLVQRRQSFSIVEQFLKYQNLEDRDVLLNALEHHCGVRVDTVSRMSIEELRVLASMGFAIGAHTHSHPILSLCEPAQAAHEIASVREDLEALLATSVKSFAYPNGRPMADFNSEHVAIVKAAGYHHAVTTDWGAATSRTSVFEIPRFTPWGPSAARMAMQVARNLMTKPRQVDRVPLSQPRKILLVENGAGFGGAVIALKSLVSNVDSKQAQYHIVTNTPIPDLDTLPAVKCVYLLPDRSFDARKFAERLRLSLPKWLHAPVLFGVGRLDDLINRLPYLVRLAMRVRSLRPDIVHGNNEPNSNREAMLLSRLLNIPYIQHVRGPIANTRIAPWLLSAPAAFVPVSRWLAGDLLMRGVPSRRIRQVYDGVDMSRSGKVSRNLREELGLSTDVFIVGMIGMLVPWKGQDLFIDAVSRRGLDVDNIVYLLFGDTPELGDSNYASKLKQQVSRLGLDGKVRFMGRQTGLMLLMSQIDVVVSASTEPEPLGLVMIEAMANGCAFVAPAFGAATEVIDDGSTGFLFKPKDADDLARALDRALNSRKQDPDLPDRAQRRVSTQFSPKRCVEHTLRVYATIPLP